MNNNKELIYGCMRLSRLSYEEAEKIILHAIDKGITIFDHSNIYGAGKCEELFGEIVSRNNLRSKIKIQTKCGIKKNQYDLSKESIIEEVNKSLERLKTDYLDILLLHRPDALTDYSEINEAFNYLKKTGKVKEFGVSNMNSHQLMLFKKYVKEAIKYNQLQFSLVHSILIDQGMYVNMNSGEAIDKSSGTLEYCLLNDIRIQAWSPLMASWEEGTFIDNKNYEKLNLCLEEIANKYKVSKGTIAISWILRLPANIIPISGTTKIERLDEAIKALEIVLSREEWYRLYLSKGHILP